MGLDNFKSEDSTDTTKKSSSSSKSTKKKKKNKPFKVVGVGNKTKVFKDEDMWNRTVEYIENEMGFGIDEVLKWPNKYMHKCLHIAIINSKGDKQLEFDVTKECIVCGHTFEFPEDWDFMKYKENIVCPTHEYQDIVDAHMSKNTDS